MKEEEQATEKVCERSRKQKEDCQAVQALSLISNTKSTSTQEGKGGDTKSGAITQ